MAAIRRNSRGSGDHSIDRKTGSSLRCVRPEWGALGLRGRRREAVENGRANPILGAGGLS